MKRWMIPLALVVLALAFAGVVQSDEKKADEKRGDKPAAGAVAPHPLDDAFKNARSERDMTNGLLNNRHYQKAIREAFKAKQEQEERFRKEPTVKDASPAQKARQKFIEVLKSEEKQDKWTDLLYR